MPQKQQPQRGNASRRGVIRQQAGTHTRVVPNKKKQQNKKACRKWKHHDGGPFGW